MSTSVITSHGAGLNADITAPSQINTKQNRSELTASEEPLKQANGNSVPVESLAQLKAAEAQLKQDEANQQESEQSQSLIEESIESVANFVNSVSKNVDFLVDEDSGRTVIKIIDVKSQELIRQFPSDEIISMATRIKELQEQISSKTGLFLDESV